MFIETLISSLSSKINGYTNGPGPQSSPKALLKIHLQHLPGLRQAHRLREAGHLTNGKPWVSLINMYKLSISILVKDRKL